MKALIELIKSVPFLANLFSKWIDLQEKKLPMKIEAYEERKEVREIDAKWDAERREDKGLKKDHKRTKRMKRKGIIIDDEADLLKEQNG